MKTFRKFGIEIKFDLHFSLKKVKRIEVSIPDWADDAHLRQGNIFPELKTPDGKPKVCYYKGSKVYFIDIPECKKSVEVSVSKLYNKERTGFNTDRKVIIDLYY